MAKNPNKTPRPASAGAMAAPQVSASAGTTATHNGVSDYFHLGNAPSGLWGAKNGRIPALDGCRVLFMLLVSWFHIWQQSWIQPIWHIGTFTLNLDYIPRNGFMTVEAFLVLSGFCLFMPLCRTSVYKPPRWSEFYTKRVARIMPSVAVMLLVCGWFRAKELGEAKDVVFSAFSELFLFSNFNADWFWNGLSINGTTWTVIVEMQFYILFPLLIVLFRRAPFWVTTAAVVLCSVYRTHVLTIPNFSAFEMHALPGLMDAFFIGMLGAKICSEIKLSERTAAFLFGTGATFFVALLKWAEARPADQTMQFPQMNHRPFFMLAACMMLIAAPYLGKIPQMILGNKVVAFFSAISFNFYLWHQWLAVKIKEWDWIPHNPVYQYPQQDPAYRWPYFFVWLAVAVGVATLATYGIERPVGKLILKAGRKLFKPRPQLAA